MNKTAIIAAAAVVASAGAAFAQPAGTVELRIVTAATFDATGAVDQPIGFGPINVDPSAVSFSQDFYVQALITGDATATGLVTFDGNLSDDSTGLFLKAGLTNTEAIGVPVPGDDFQMRTGMFPSYRATIGGDNSNAGNGQEDMGTGNWTFLPLNISPSGNGEAIGGVWSNIYKFSWNTSDVSARTVTLSALAEFGGYQSDPDGLQQPAPIVPGTFSITFVPAPGEAALLGLGGVMAVRRRR